MPSITLKSSREIALMRSAGLVVWEAHQAAAQLVRPGATTAEIDAAIENVFIQHDAIPLFKGVPGVTPFPAATCVSINEEVVHGMPGSRQLVEGDIVSLDTGCKVNGWCGDAAVTHAVGTVSPIAAKLLEITQGSLQIAIDQMSRKSRWSEVAREMQEYVEAADFSVVTEFVGHGIGREMHESPQVPNYFSKRFLKEGDFPLRTGLVLAVEPMVNVGKREAKVTKDHWTVVTCDGSLSAHFEHTLALTSDGVEILTGPPS
ncbi:type I methionyl aminopeptidase [Blastopirellula marina]|uniref:type I methionyl aminopeptidase n=1 Tax=Blastopirellula marina TaxID=124 RepID=UPI0003257283|nr:type I methionyl aminopeptidase [Blastopirellula marina]